VDHAGNKVPATAELKEDGSFNIRSELTGEQSGTIRGEGKRLSFETAGNATGTITHSTDAEGNDVLTWKGLAPSAAEPGGEAAQPPVSLELERRK
jgi:hypothetical protein